MGEIWESFPDAPPINMLVISKSKNIASKGADTFLRDYFGLNRVPSQARKSELADLAVNDVWDFGGWAEIYHEITGANWTDTGQGGVQEFEDDGQGDNPKFGGLPESPEHRRLKEFVCANPIAVGLRSLPRVPSAPIELESFARIDWALRKIMGEVKHNRGEYPYSSRAPTIREVLFRAGLSARYLENQNGTPSRETLKARYKEKIKRVLRRVKSGRYHSARRIPKADENRHEPSHWLELREKLQSLKQRWVEQELEYIEAQNCIQEYEGRLREMTAEVDRLRNLLAASNIHILHRPTGQ